MRTKICLFVLLSGAALLATSVPLAGLSRYGIARRQDGVIYGDPSLQVAADQATELQDKENAYLASASKAAAAAKSASPVNSTTTSTTSSTTTTPLTVSTPAVLLAAEGKPTGTPTTGSGTPTTTPPPVTGSSTYIDQLARRNTIRM